MLTRLAGIRRRLGRELWVMICDRNAPKGKRHRRRELDGDLALLNTEAAHEGIRRYASISDASEHEVEYRGGPNKSVHHLKNDSRNLCVVPCSDGGDRM